MRRFTPFHRPSVFLALLLAATAVWAAPNFPELGPGLTFSAERDDDHPWATFVLRVDRAHPEYTLATSLAQGTVFGLETVPDQVRHFPPALGTPVAAVNGDWFELRVGPYQGDLTNLLVHRGELVSTSAWGDTFWLDPQGAPHLAHVVSALQVTWPDGSHLAVGLNAARKDDAAVLYTPVLGPSTRTVGGRELVLGPVGEAPPLSLQVGRPLRARVTEVRTEGDTALPAGGLVLSLGPQVVAPVLRVGEEVTLSATTVPDLTGVTVALGGGQTLVKEGVLPDFGAGDQPRHPRTAFGWNDTTYFLIVVDGRRPGWSVGMTVPELAAFARRLGCTYAVNLDGGGSSTFCLGEQVMNLPSDGAPRAVGNALLVVRTK